MCRFVKILLVIAGTITLLVGLLGIVIPGLPVTPFLLLSAWLYCRSSQKLYNKLLNNKLAGKYIKKYRENKGMLLKTKLYSIALMWLMITVSVMFFINSDVAKYVVVGFGIIGSVVMGFIIKTVKL